ncbi:MAG TPA: radical SAM/SPASM domain-containing protein [Bryobacteraceae bacterium]|jgi:MoaA/NifB/PqqE/SkfB family radical SAM enzyme
MPVHPRSLQIDASSHCQLACPSCPTATGAARPALGAGHLDPAHFRDLLDRNPDLTDVELSNYGEMFLNPKLVELLQIAHERQVVLHADNGVNLNHAPEAALEALVQYRFCSMTCSIDGASPETYRRYRVNGDFDKVLRNIDLLNKYKRQRRSGFPFLKWQFVVFGHNEHEIATARKLAADLGMAFVPKLTWDEDFSPLRNRELVQLQVGVKEITRGEFYQAHARDYARAICTQLWNAPVLNWDGRVTGCCRNFWGDFGANAFTQGLAEAVHAEPIEYARQMLLGRAPERESLPCTTCELYQRMRHDGRWLTEEEIAGTASRGLGISLVPEPASPGVTHVDLLLTAGAQVNRQMLENPPQGPRFTVGSSFSIAAQVPAPGDYTVYAFPRRREYPPIPPSTHTLHVTARPIAQEFSFPV